ncbi:hypothetical protein HPB49_004460 [Dermacentor silvarum]|uniref:Uncharacterized protein n=1 Tax=Dermacentor silvarum TaxID=543639 RepID=A0ACB8C794_DERSI|nr:hypothetical protein HPB49_004460 [Dermacentor silvarum]
MFVPPVGTWSQVLGTFASHENVKGDLLAKIVLETTVLAEKAGLFVDFLTCDAASGNRDMWRKFNIHASSKEVVCKTVHPVDSNHFLHFFSEFLHLLKNVRNQILNTTFNTPEGQVSLQFLKEAFKLDSDSVILKAMPSITAVHLMPNNFEKMRSQRQQDLHLRVREAEIKCQHREEDAEFRAREAEARRQQRQDYPEIRAREAEAKRLRRRAEAKHRARETLSQHVSAINMFDKRFTQNPFGCSCSVCDRLWHKHDLKPLAEAHAEAVAAAFHTDVFGFEAIRRDRIPTNGCVYPPKPPHLPKLDLVSERLVSPRIPFMQIRRLVYSDSAIRGPIVNVPINNAERVHYPEDEPNPMEAALAMSLSQQTLVIDDSNVLVVASGEEITPQAEELSFPQIYLGEPRNINPGSKPSVFTMASSECRRTDQRGAASYHVLYMAAKVMRTGVASSVNVFFRNTSGMGVVSKVQLEDREFVENAVDHDMAFMNGVPNTVQYWHRRKQDVAMIRQLASEIHWDGLVRLLQRLHIDPNHPQGSFEQLRLYEKSMLVSDDPVLCSVYFDEIVRVMMQILQHKTVSPFAPYVANEYVKRIEFQRRGSAHPHLLLWLENVPNEEIAPEMAETVRMAEHLMSLDAESI